jgi:hypothetical protein
MCGNIHAWTCICRGITNEPLNQVLMLKQQRDESSKQE